MPLRFVLYICFFLCFYTSTSQNNAVLLHIDDEAISTSEFMKLYNKNLDLVEDDAQKQVDNYLDLFINYQLKLKEANAIGLHNDAKFQKEFLAQKARLTKNYISDDSALDTLVEEAYERLQYEVKASHILIKHQPKTKDTLDAYNRLMAYRPVLQDEGYAVAKQKYHDGSVTLVEDLGYFSTFRMVYDFETMAYKTKVGEVSMPFKTRFGYHIVKVEDKRPSQGRVTVAHIMVSHTSNDSLSNPEERIQTIYKKLEAGESFDALAMQFSDDKNSARQGGKLRPFTSGQLNSAVFEEAAFGIKTIGAYTQPLQTSQGWHIIKLLNKQTLESFETLKPNLQAQVRRDTRSQHIKNMRVSHLEKRYTITKNPNTKPYFETFVTTSKMRGGHIQTPKHFKAEDVVFTINATQYTNTDFLRFIQTKIEAYKNKTHATNLINVLYADFYKQSVLAYRAQNLINENEEYAALLEEYRNGMLIFELMEREIWNKALNDSIGLRTYFMRHQSKYFSEERIDAVIATTTNNNVAKVVQQLLNQGLSETQIKHTISAKYKHTVIFTTGIFDVSSQRLPHNFKKEKGVSEPYLHNETYHVINVKAVLPSKAKNFEEVKGLVVNDYQNYLETQWLMYLKSKFAVTVDADVLAALKSKIEAKL